MAGMRSRAPNRMGKEPKERRGCGELTEGLGREVEAPAEEIDGEGRSSSSPFVAATLRG
jgi:hypothetical protein